MARHSLHFLSPTSSVAPLPATESTCSSGRLRCKPGLGRAPAGLHSAEPRVETKDHSHHLGKLLSHIGLGALERGEAGEARRPCGPQRVRTASPRAA